MHRWVTCHARLSSDGVLTLLSVEAWSLRLRVVLRTASAILRLGPASWRYLRLQTPNQAVCMHVDGGDAPLEQWVLNLERVSGLHLVSMELTGWLELQVLAPPMAADGR